MDVTQALNEIFREVFDDAGIEVFPHTTANDIDGWDSLSHVNLIVTIETRLGVTFLPKELLTFKNVGDLMASIRSKIA